MGQHWPWVDPDMEDGAAASSYWSQNLRTGDLRVREPVRVLQRPLEEPLPTAPPRRTLAVWPLLLVLAVAGLLFFLKPWAWSGRAGQALAVGSADRMTRKESPDHWVPVEDGDPVGPLTSLRSGSGRTGVLQVQGGATLRLDRDSVLDVGTLVRGERDGHRVRATLYVGRAFVREGARDSVKVDTVLARLEPGSADYEVSHLKGKDGIYYTRVTVHRGGVQVSLPRTSGGGVDVEAGQTLQVAPGRLGKVRPLGRRDDWEDWNLAWTDLQSMPAFQEGSSRDHERLKLPPMKPVAPGRQAGPPASGVPAALPGRSYPSGQAPSGGTPRQARPPGAGGSAGPAGSQPPSGGGAAPPPRGSPSSGGSGPRVNPGSASGSYPNAAPVTDRRLPGY